MNTWKYTDTNENKTNKYLPRFATITIMQFDAKKFVLSGDFYGITNKTYKTLKGAMAYIERNYSSFELTETRICREF